MIERIILEKFKVVYSKEQVVDFCKMASEMFKQLDEDLKKRGVIKKGFDEYEYDWLSQWWNAQYEELKRNL